MLMHSYSVPCRQLVRSTIKNQRSQTFKAFYAVRPYVVYFPRELSLFFQTIQSLRKAPPADIDDVPSDNVVLSYIL